MIKFFVFLYLHDDNVMTKIECGKRGKYIWKKKKIMQNPLEGCACTCDVGGRPSKLSKRDETSECALVM